MSRPEQFEGRIGRTVAESEPWFDEPPHPGEAAPNVVFVLLDDTGFAQFGCYGSTIDTPNIDALAADGLQFTNFHVTPLCSPTTGVAADRPLAARRRHARPCRTSAPGSRNSSGHISNHAATVAEVLRDEGYATFCAGKWHLAPMEQCSAAGPFDQWPLARGFDRFYGFLEGETDQFHPELVCDNHPDRPARRSRRRLPPVARTSSTRLLRMIADSKGVRPDRPFFAYLAVRRHPRSAPGAGRRTSAKYRGAFDEGWDVMRQRWFERQLEHGRRPRGHAAGAAQPGRRAVGRAAREPAAPRRRLQEAFAAFLDHTDDQIGRFVDGLARLGRARQHAPDRARRQRRLAGGRPVRRDARDEVLQRHPRDARRGDRSASTTSAARTATPTIRGGGRSAATHRSSGTSRTPTRAACTCR